MEPHRIPLALPEPLRSWRDAGLEFLLGEAKAHPLCAPVATQPVERKASPQPGQDWPEPWKTQLDRVQRPRPAIWTYLELGCDLCGRPEPLRRGLWASIIEGLGWPKGSVVFWPFSHLHGEHLHHRPDLFWRGVPILDPPLIVMFGEQALRELLPEATPAYGMIRTADRPCLFLPGPGELLPDNRQAKLVVWEFLKHVTL
jgi:hypothetical protein